MLRELLRIVGWVTFSVLLVLLVPSSAWSAGTESPQPSPSSSPSDGSSTASPDPTPIPEPSPTDEPTPSPTPTPEPTVTETVTVSPEPVPAEPSCTRTSPCVVEPSRESVTLTLLLGGVSMMALLGLLVRSFAGR